MKQPKPVAHTPKKLWKTTIVIWSEDDPQRMELTDLAREVVSLGGTVGAEHGLGKRKAHLLNLQYGPEHIAAMKQVKARFDPHGLLGRGTLFSAPAL